MIPTKMRSNSAMRIHRYFGALVRAICEPEFRFCSGGLGPVRAAEDNIRVVLSPLDDDLLPWN